MNNRKRSHPAQSDLNNNELVQNSTNQSKRRKVIVTTNERRSYTIGQIKQVRMINFMCHKNFSIEFQPIPMQIVTGANGSGKSAIANAICLCFGAQARTTGRTTIVQSFIRKGETSAEISIILANEGPEAFKPDIYGNEIHIIRKISARQSAYKILSASHKLISTRKETIDEIAQALSISPENPLCVLHQETAKTFLLNNDPRKKYQFYMKVSQLDQIKQAYEESVCIVETIRQRLQTMKQKYNEMLRSTFALEQEVKKIEIRRDQEGRKHALENELTAARFNETEQELINMKNELDQTEKSKDIIEARMNEITKEISKIDQRIEQLTNEKMDIEQDLLNKNGLQELKYRFSKENREIQLMIYRLSRECEKDYQTLKDLEQEQIRLKQHINEYETLTQNSCRNEQERERIDKEIRECQQKQIELDKIMNNYINEINMHHDHIQQKQTAIQCIKIELKQKQQDMEERKNIERNEINVYGEWMFDCLKEIENERRFHKKPIGPIGRYIHCTQTHWAYAVEKHLAPIMSAFVCADNHDERILLDILSHYSFVKRPPVYVMRYAERPIDVSGTLARVRQANLLSIYQVLRVENLTVECILIDNKQIEATILLENFEQAKRIRQSGILNWPKVDRKVKQVAEAWTYDGSNIKLNSAFRIYTDDKQPARYFTSRNAQTLSRDQLNIEINRLNEQIQQMNLARNKSNELKQILDKKVEEIKSTSQENRTKLKELKIDLERFNAQIPDTCCYSIDELKEKLCDSEITYNKIKENFEREKDEKEKQHQLFEETKQQCDNIMKKIEMKKEDYERICEKIQEEQSERHEIEEQISKLDKKFAQLNEDIQKYHERFNELSKNRPKKLKAMKATTRSVRDIQVEIDAINNFLRSNEDTIEKRRQIIDEYKTKRDSAQDFKKNYDRFHRNLQRLNLFVNKRKENFARIADQQEYLLRHKFRNLMEKHKFNDCDIKVDHKKEELEIIIGNNQRSAASLSGGERSVSTFSFLLALWGSIYQPFRLLDEIDIYMDNEKRNLSLELLYENTQFYASSQHVIFTPQAIDPQIWNDLNVPIFCMPTPRRMLS